MDNTTGLDDNDRGRRALRRLKLHMTGVVVAIAALLGAAGCPKNRECAEARVHAKNSWSLVAQGATVRGKKVHNPYTRAAAALTMTLAAEPRGDWGEHVRQAMADVLAAHAKQVARCGDDASCKQLWRHPKAAVEHTEHALEFCCR
jgi:hypothetical protein